MAYITPVYATLSDYEMKIQLGGERDLFNSKMAGSNALLAACNSPIARNIINSRRFGKKKKLLNF